MRAALRPMLYFFDGYSVDTDRRTLSCGDALIELTPKVFQTLVVLIENNDHVMSKDELLRTIWPHHIVEEANITQNISVLRRALEERQRGKKYIATFPGVGYRFLEPVAVKLARKGVAAEASDEMRTAPMDPLPATTAGIGGESSRSSGAGGLSGRWITGLILLMLAVGGVAVVMQRVRLAAAQRATASVRPASIRNSDARKADMQSIDVRNLRTIVRMQGASYEPALSSDGRTLVFVHIDVADGRSSIDVLFDKSLQPRVIASGGGEYSSPVFSPDGNEVAFLHFHPNTAEIEIVNLKSGNVRAVARVFPHRYGLNCRHLDWSPDGKNLVVDDKVAETDPLSLYLIAVSNGVRTRVSDPTMDIIGDVAPRFSPDSTHIAFIRMKYQYEFDVYAVPIGGGSPQLVTPHSTTVGDVDWAGNERLLYSAESAGRYRLWNANLATAPIVAAPASTYESDMPLQFAIARGAKRVALSAYRPDLNIWSLGLGNRAHDKAQWTPAVRTPGQDIGPVFSPDGKRIAFRSDVNGRMQLWISQRDGSAARVLDTGKLSPSYLAWSPDGSTMAFSAEGDIYETSTTHDSPLQRLTHGGFSHPEFSVDGRWIFARQHNVIFRLPVGRPGAPQKVTDDGGAPIMQSADGRYLFFGHDRMDTTVSRLDLRTGEQAVVLRDLVPGYRECWTPMPGGLIYLGERTGRPTLLFHSLEGGHDRVIGEFPGPLPPVATSRFTVSPDGSHLLIVRADPASSSIQEGDLQLSAE